MIVPVIVAARSHPDSLAYDDGITQINYAALEALLNEAREAQVSALSPFDHVAWCPRNDFDSYLTYWTLQHVDCVACPISRKYPNETRAKIVGQLNAIWLPDLQPQETDAGPSSERPEYDPSRPSTIILSSGTTATPKAIVHSMFALAANAVGANMNMPLEPNDRWLWSLPLYHISGVAILVRCALAGATVAGMRQEDKLTTELLQQRGVTHLSVVATQLQRLLEDNNFPNPELKAVLLGGSCIPPQLVSDARARGANVFTTYGLTEMGSQVTTSLSDDDPASSGRRLSGREIRITATGEILVRGQTLCLGYYIDGKVQSIVDDEGWFRTGDRGSLEQGQLSVIGRIDNMFISGGENIHPEPIERALVSLPGVEQAMVVPKSDPEFGSRPVAFIRGTMPSHWEASLRESLRGFEIPTQIIDWPVEEQFGIKPDRRALQKLAESTSSAG